MKPSMKIRLTSLLVVGSVGAGLAGCGGTVTHTVTKVSTPTYQTPYGPSAHSPTFGLHPSNIPLPPPLSPTAASQTLLMLDSVDSSTSIFSGFNPTVVAGYTGGSWPTYFDYRGHFPYVVAVMVQSSFHGIRGAARSCLDVEPGDATPSEAGPWAVQEVHLGFKPCVYGSLSEFSAINSSIGSSHPADHVFRWCADWTYYAHLDNGCDAVQWTNHYGNRNIDGSTVTYAFVGKTTKPPPPPPPKNICFGKHWQHTTYCNTIRRQDANRGRQIKQQMSFAHVSQANITKYQHLLGIAQGNLKRENSILVGIEAALNKSLVANGCRDAGHGRVVCR